LEDEMYHYLKHSFFVVTIPIVAILVVVAPDWAFVAPLAIAAFHILIDIGTPRETSVPSYRMPGALDAYLYLHVMVSLLSLGALLWVAAPGDLWGVGQWLDRRFNLDLVGTSDHASWSALVAAGLTVGFLISTNTLVGHELVHRTTDRFAMFTGRWLLALAGDAQFSISHVYGHHVNVGTPQDPATARRGENLYAFVLRSTLGQYREAWEIEQRKLRGRSWLSRLLANKVVSGIAMTAIVVVGFYAYTGTRGLVAYALALILAKVLFEGVNYIEHYGLVRAPGTRVEPRHSWDCSTRAASNILMNLTRHSHHHADARVKYWALKPVDGTLDLPYGYFGHIIMAMIPPLWHRFAAPRLAEWDDKTANPGERELAAQANRQSRHRLFAGTKAQAVVEDH